MKETKISKIKQEKAITLVALVITIIILIILATIAINFAFGDNGLIKRAEDARDYYANDTAYTDSSISNVESYLDEIIGKKEETTYKTVEDLKAGDRVYYDTGNKGIIECIVLYDKEYNETNGTNYGIQIISADTLEDNITLGDNDPTATGSSDFEKALNSYNNAIVTLNTKAEEYLNKVYADDTRCVGSVPNNKNSESGNYVSEDGSSSSYTFKDIDMNYYSDYDQLSSLNILKSNSDYWMASRCLTYVSGDPTFGLSYVYYQNGYLAASRICSYNEMDSSYMTNGFRPVITLKPEIKITEGNGDTIPYTLEV